MKKTLLFAVVALLGLSAMAQDKVQITPYGFVRNYVTFDNRSMYTVCGGDYNNMPYDETFSLPVEYREFFDEVDANDVKQLQFHALSTRFGLRLNGPSVFGAKSTGRIEADFAGFGNNNTVLRLRLAWVDLNWNDRHAIRIGQDWHPLSGEIMPDALGFAAGAPFRAHSRTPQIRYTLSTACGFGIQAHLLWQYQFLTNGPDGASEKYANRSLIPEGFLGINFKKGRVYAQLGADILTIRPRVQAENTMSILGKEYTYKTDVDELFSSISPTAYFQYVDDLFSVKVRSTFAQNTAHVNQISGYGISAVNPDGSYDYTPLRSSVSYVNFAFGKKYKLNLFLGFMKNLGTADDLAKVDGKYVMYLKNNTISNVDYMWRVAPSFSYNLQHFNIGLECELTGVNYGDKSKMKADATFDSDDTHTVYGNRICLLVKYNF